MTRFDFENMEGWDVSTDRLLPVGNHVCEIKAASSTTSSKGNPQIELEVANDSGSRKDWVVYAEENGARKVVSLFKGAGVVLPTADEQGDDGKLTDECVARLVGKRVGVVIREEESYKEPGKMVPRIKGYVDPAVIGHTQQAPATSASGVRDEDIPF